MLVHLGGFRWDMGQMVAKLGHCLPGQDRQAARSHPSVCYVQAKGASPAPMTTHAVFHPGAGWSRCLWARRMHTGTIPSQAAGWEKACECVCRQDLEGMKRQHAPARQSLK